MVVLAVKGTASADALRAAGEARPFEDGLREIVSLGGDTDTNASVAGALLGALHGVEALPPRWLARLDEATLIRREAEALAGLVA